MSKDEHLKSYDDFFVPRVKTARISSQRKFEICLNQIIEFNFPTDTEPVSLETILSFLSN